MMEELPELSVNRNEKSRPGQVDHQLQLFLTRMAGDVHSPPGFVVHGRAPIAEVVYEMRNAALVSRDSSSADDDGITCCHGEFFVLSQGELCEGRQGLPLAAGAQEDELVVRNSRGFARVGQRSLGNCQIPQLPGDADVLFHAPAHSHYAPPTLPGQFQSYLDP